MLGASVRVINLQAIGQELALLPSEVTQFLDRLEVPIIEAGPHRVVDLFALECGWHRRLNPQFWDHNPGNSIEIIEKIGQLYHGAHRATFLKRLRNEGKALFPDIQEAKKARQRQERERQRRRQRS